MSVHAVDTTGAEMRLTGFRGQLRCWRRCVCGGLIANVAAGLSVQSFGTAPAMPYRRDIVKALKEWNVRPDLQVFNS